MIRQLCDIISCWLRPGISELRDFFLHKSQTLFRGILPKFYEFAQRKTHIWLRPSLKIGFLHDQSWLNHHFLNDLLGMSLYCNPKLLQCWCVTFWRKPRWNVIGRSRGWDLYGIHGLVNRNYCKEGTHNPQFSCPNHLNSCLINPSGDSYFILGTHFTIRALAKISQNPQMQINYPGSLSLSDCKK